MEYKVSYSSQKTVTAFPKEGYVVCFWIGDLMCVSVRWELSF